MADQQHSLSARRRSSVAYDPARDTFKEIPATIPESAIVDSVIRSSPRSSAEPRSRSPADDARKRKRSGSVEKAIQTEQNGRSSPAGTKKQKYNEPSPRYDERTQRRPESLEPVRSTTNLPRVPKVSREDGEIRSRPERVPSAFSRRSDLTPESNRDRNGDRYNHRERERDKPQRRSRSPDSRVPTAYRRRDPPPRPRRDPSRSPSPIRPSPPREQIRPGGARGRGRNVLAEQQRLAAERGQGHVNNNNVNQGVQGVANQWYNTLPEYVRERGRDWRRNESQIKGLRPFNNWVKSCLIQKFSPQEKRTEQEEELSWGETAKEPEEMKPLLVLDIGCGKGGDLGKWEKAPQAVGLYVGLDPAETSISQAEDRFRTMWRGRRPRFDARFAVKDCFGEWLGDVPIVQEVGMDPAPGQINRWGRGGGFDVVTMMFSMHYAFESKEKVEMMLRNVAGSLKKGGRFIGVCPNSDVIADHVRKWYEKNPQHKPADGTPTVPPQAQPNGDSVVKDSEPEEGETTEESPQWGNKIYSVRFPSNSQVAADGSFRPPFGWKYTYWMTEAVDVPEFVVPWEALRAIAEHFGLEQRYRRGFLDIWHTETDPNRATTGGDTAAVARELMSLGVRMGVVREAGGPMSMSEDEKEAVGFYHGFCFVKV